MTQRASFALASAIACAIVGLFALLDKAPSTQPVVADTFGVFQGNEDQQTPLQAVAPTVSLSASPPSITNGQSSTLVWTSTNATSLEISGIGIVGGPNGSLQVQPSATTTYLIQATGEGGQANASVTVTVNPPQPSPTVNLTVSDSSILRGQGTTLSWNASNASSLSISGLGPVQNPSGTLLVRPTTTTTYTITATNSTGSATDSVQVNVTTPVVPTLNFSAQRNSITFGESTTLSWTSSNAKRIELNPGHQNVAKPNGSITVSPQQTTTYQLVAIGTGGSVTRSLTVTVSPPPPKPQPEQEPENQNFNPNQTNNPTQTNNPSNQDSSQNGPNSANADPSSPVTTAQPDRPRDIPETISQADSLAEYSENLRVLLTQQNPEQEITFQPRVEVGDIPLTQGQTRILSPDGSEINSLNTRSVTSVVEPVQTLLYGIKVPKDVLENENIRPMLDVINDVENARQNPIVQTISAAVVAPAATIVSVASATTAMATNVSGLITYLYSFFGQVMTLSGRKRRLDSGQVIDSATGKPISLAIVRLHTIDNKLLQTKITDALGQYRFIVGPGTYKITAQKDGFGFPPTLGSWNVEDNVIKVQEPKAVIQINLPMDPLVNLTNLSSLQLLALRSTKRIQKLLVLGGFTFSIVAFVVSPQWLTAGLLMFQALMYGAVKKFQDAKTIGNNFGIAKSVSGTPVSKAVVRLLDPHYHRIIAYEVTDDKGRYAFSIEDVSKKFELVAEANGYQKFVKNDVTADSKTKFVMEEIILVPKSKLENSESDVKKPSNSQAKIVEVKDIHLEGKL